MNDPGLAAVSIRPSTQDLHSVAIASSRWRARFVALFVLEQVLKWILAWRLAPFSDEAFYWQESRRLAWGYSDLPGMTAWLIRLGETLGGHHVLAMRAPFLLLGASLPWLVRAVAAREFGARCGWQAGLWALVLPLIASLGVLALPDVPLTVAAMLCLQALLGLARSRPGQAWLLLGLALAAALATHYRAAPLVAVSAWLALFTVTGHRWWRQAGWWWALLLAALGLVPVLICNWQLRGAGLAFQLWQRNPWQFHADALLQPVEQAVVSTPVLYGLLLWALWQSWRRWRQAWIWQVSTVMGAGFLFGYAVLGLFADDLRFRVHWPLPGYLPLLVVLPALLAQPPVTAVGRRVAIGAWGLALAGLLAGWCLLWLTSWSPLPQPGWWGKAFPSALTGWDESARRAQQLLAPGQGLLADNFILAAELDFALAGRQPVYVLDSPLNRLHGRAPQLAYWRLDASALRQQHAGEKLLLVVDENALRERWRWPALEQLCAQFKAIEPRGRLVLEQGHRRFSYYQVQLAAAGAAQPSRCVIWQQAYAAVYAVPH